MNIYADEFISGLRIGNCQSNETDAGKFYSWGTRNMIDSVSKVAYIHADSTQRMYKGAYARGGTKN